LTLVSLLDFPEVGEAVEDGLTLEENAVKKAEWALRKTGLCSLADDTGLEVDALGGRPGVHSSRYAGPGASYADNVRRLLTEMQSVPEGRRGATFRTVVAICFPDEPTRVVEGRCRGRILRRPRGEGGFGYDPVFVPDGETRTFAEMDLAEKNAVSHRGKALAAAREVLERILSSRR